MNKILSRLFVLLIFVLTGCEQKGCAAAEVEYEFLTPQVLVIKNSKPYMHTSHNVVKQGLWQKENALLRDKNGNILRKADVTTFAYFIFGKPLKDGETVSIAGTVAKYDSAVPSNIFKLNQVGNGAGQRKNMPTWARGWEIPERCR